MERDPSDSSATRSVLTGRGDDKDEVDGDDNNGNGIGPLIPWGSTKDMTRRTREETSAAKLEADEDEESVSCILIHPLAFVTFGITTEEARSCSRGSTAVVKFPCRVAVVAVDRNGDDVGKVVENEEEIRVAVILENSSTFLSSLPEVAVTARENPEKVKWREYHVHFHHER